MSETQQPQRDRFGRALAIGDLVLTNFDNYGIVTGFTLHKVRLANWHSTPWDLATPGKVSESLYKSTTLIILREETFSELPWGAEIINIRQGLGF